MPSNSSVSERRQARPDSGPVKRLRLPAKLRDLELVLLLIACGINAAAVVLVQLGAEGHVDLTLIYYGAGLSALVLGMHVALRFVAPQADPFLLPIATVLTGLGIAEIYRIDIHYKVTGW